MIHYFCPYCWQDFLEDYQSCPACGRDLRESWTSLGYTDMLIRALRHPVTDVRMRAAWILGRLHAAKAVEALIEATRGNTDVYELVELTRALGEIGSSEALAFVKTLTEHPAAMVRAEARRALMSHPSRHGARGNMSLGERRSDERQGSRRLGS
jgi:HEAT repeat protein